MFIVSCSTKFHSFDLSTQLAKNNLLTGLYTTYHSKKNTLINRFHHRQDLENIPQDKIHTFPILAPLIKKYPQNAYFWNHLFEQYVAHSIRSRKDYKGLIGWSGMSLEAIRTAKKANKITLVERGSSHILYQNNILKQEYKKLLGIDFEIDKRVIKKELQEYHEADFIVIPSVFVKQSFLEYGVPESKLFHNPFGVSSFFKPSESPRKNDKFRILYLGGMNIRKGLVYLFEALKSFNIPQNDFEVWFIGGMTDEIKPFYEKFKKPNWTHHGFIEEYNLTHYINQCDVAIQPSLEEGLARVIPQVLGCGIPVIATTNSGGEDVIREGETGFVIPIRDSGSIQEKLQELYFDRTKLQSMKIKAAQSALEGLSWDKYGDRYSGFLKKLL
jgi:glycosyltransferase involved in cell wall biosynthesis